MNDHVRASVKPAQVRTSGEIVFVGHGVDAPEYNWNDYRGLDVRGKTLVMLVNDPAVILADVRGAAHQIVDRDPTDVLLAAAHDASQAELEGSEHFPERAAARCARCSTSTTTR